MKIVSTMGSGDLGREIDLSNLIDALETQLGHEVKANFSNPGMVTIRLHPGDPALTIYRTGSFQIRGAESKKRLEKYKDSFLSELDNIGFKTEDCSFEIKTAIFVYDFNRHIDLGTLAVACGLENVEYEPEQFPAMIYRPPEVKATALVFSSGKVVVSGTKSKTTAKEAIQSLESRLPKSNEEN